MKMRKRTNEHPFLFNLEMRGEKSRPAPFDLISHHPDHLADLRKSGLSDETIKKADIYSVPPRDINKKLGFNAPHIESMMAFSYPDCDGFERYKLFPPLDGKKYIQPKGSVNRLYIPGTIKPILSDPSIPLYFTEGEKKILKAIQEGLHCIGSGGLWNWGDGKEKTLIPDFDKVVWKGRTVFIVPDNDWLLPNKHGYSKNLRQAVYELGYRLIDRGARIYIVYLPDGPLKGLDDYLCRHSVEKFKALPKKEITKQTLEEMIGDATLETLPEILKSLANLKETERAVHINALAKRLDVPKKAIQKDLKRNEPQGTNEIEISATAYFPELVDLCLDQNGNVVFLSNKEGNPEISTVCEIDGSLFKPPYKNKIPFLLPKAENVLTWISKDTDETLFDDLLNHLKRFSFISEHQFILTCCFTFLTYIQDHSDVQYFPMLLFWSAPERGKSRTGKAVSYCSYRGIHIVDLREANLFRFSQDFHATLFIDMMDLWKKAERSQSQDILLLRFEKGAKVPRVLYPEKGSFKDMVYFNVYGPTVMATNEPVHHILDTRCLPVSMPNKPRNYEDPTPEKLIEVRERLTAWRARVMNKPLPMVETIPGINGRLWDISRPLFQVSQMVCPSYLETLKMAVLEIAGERIEEKSETIEGQIVGVIKDLSPESAKDWNIQIQHIVDRMNDKRAEGHKLTARYVGQKIKALSLKKRRTNAGYQVELTRSAFNTLLTQFGFEYSTQDTPSETFTTFTDTHSQTNSQGFGVNVGVHVSDCSPECSPVKNKENQEVVNIVNVSERSIEGRENKTKNLFTVLPDGQFIY